MAAGDPTREEIERVVGALISQAEVAEIAGVERQTPAVWAGRHDDYPPVLAEIGNVEMRSRADVVAWLERTGRLPSKPVD